MHVRINCLDRYKKLFNHIFDLDIHLIPSHISILIFFVKHLNKFVKMNLSQLSSIIHDSEMRFIYFPGSIIISKFIIRCSYPKYLINKNFQRFYL